MSTESQEISAMASPGRHLALIIGVNGPPAPGREPLRYAVLDAQDMAQVLQENYCGFNLFPPSPLLNEESTTARVRDTILDLANEVQDGDFVLFFFSGHAEVMLLENELEDVYLVTHDFTSTRLSRDKTNQISLGWLRQVLYEHEKASDVLIILDCCYAGMFGATAPDTFLEELLQRLKYYFEGPGARSPSRSRGVRLALTATGRTTAQERDGHGLLTGHILAGLKGKAVNTQRKVTFHSLSDYLDTALESDQQPHFFGTGRHLVLATHPNLPAHMQLTESDLQLRKFLSEQLSVPSDFLLNKLKSFVGREEEVAAVRQRIKDLLLTGGYLAIMSKAGQGKSSLIAKLVDIASREHDGLAHVAHHFIPPLFRPNEQIFLLRNLIARLILKYDLPDSLLADESRPALNEAFHWILQEIARQKRSEVIYIDGLDQIAIDPEIGERDLSFLSQGFENLPAGIVFVLGTRPNETQNFLQQLKPYGEYVLEELSRDDFGLLLRRRGIFLEDSLINRIYEQLGKNALYLDLVARELELATRSSLTPGRAVEVIIQQIAHDPENRFSVTMNRLRRQRDLWERVIKPTLGLLLVTAEPLTRVQLKQLLKLASSDQVDADGLKQGLDHLGGLLVTDEQQHYTLFHLKFRDYLDQAPLFDEEEKRNLHRHFTTWCEQENLADIWGKTLDEAEQNRRLYSRLHYITHLHHAHEWDKLFRVLDAGIYGHAKINEDPSTHTYALDLDQGRCAAVSFDPTSDEAIRYLPHLWRYTLLRCTLASRADNYSEAAFRLMLLLGQEEKVLGLAEMLTSPAYKAQIFTVIANYLATKSKREREVEQLVLRTEQLIDALSGGEGNAEILIKLGDALKQIGHHQEAERLRQKAGQVSRSDASDERGDRMPTALGAALGQAEHLQEAEWVIHPSFDEEDPSETSPGFGKTAEQMDYLQEVELANHSRSQEENKAEALAKVGIVLRQIGYWQGTEQIWQDVRQLTRSLSNNGRKAEALAELAAALGQMGRRREAEQIWQEARDVISSIVDEEKKAEALATFGETLGQAKSWQRVAEIWQDVEQMIRSFSGDRQKAEALAKLGITLARAGDRQEAERIIRSISDEKSKAEVLARFATILGRAGHWQKAELVIATISEEKNKVEALTELGATLKQARYWQEAERVIRSISDDQPKSEALTAFAAALRQAGLWEEAERVIRSISDGWQKSGALAELAAALRQAEHREEAEQIWQEAEHMTHSLSDEERTNRAFKESRDRASAQYGIALAQEKRLQEAERVINSISDEESHAEALAELGIAFAQTGYWQEAELMIWQETRQVMVSLANIGSKTRVLATLGAVLGQIVHPGEVTQTWQEVEQFISSISDEKEKARALVEFGIALSEVGYGIEAEQIWQKAEEMIHSISDRENNVEALANLGAVLGQAGRWQMARSVIDSINDTWRKVKALVNLGEVLGQVGHRFEAKQIWQKAEKMIHAIAEEESSDQALGELEDTLGQVEPQNIAEEEDSRQALGEFGDILEQVGPQDSGREIEALIEHAAVLGRMGQREEAEQILSEVEPRIRSIADNNSRDLAWTRLGEEWGRARRWKEAERVIEEISQKESKAWPLAKLGVMLGQARHWAKARQMIHSITDEKSKIWAQAKLGVALGQAGRWQEAMQEIHSIADEKNKTEALAELIAVLQQAEDWQEVEQIWQEVEQTWQEIEQKIPSLSSKESGDRALVNFGTALGQAERWQTAEEVIRSISDEESKNQALVKLGAALEKAERWQEARQVALSIVDETSKVEALAELGVTWGQAGDTQEVEQIWQEAEQVAFSIVDETSKDRVLMNLSAALTQAERWQEARQVALSIVDEKSQNWASVNLDEALEQVKQLQEAEPVIHSISYESLAQTKPGEVEQVGRRQRTERAVRPVSGSRRATAVSPGSADVRPEDDAREPIRNLQKQWLHAASRDEALDRFLPVCSLIPQYPELGINLWQGFTWVDDFLSS